MRPGIQQDHRKFIKHVLRARKYLQNTLCVWLWFLDARRGVLNPQQRLTMPASDRVGAPTAPGAPRPASVWTLLLSHPLSSGPHPQSRRCRRAGHRPVGAGTGLSGGRCGSTREMSAGPWPWRGPRRAQRVRCGEGGSAAPRTPAHAPRWGRQSRERTPLLPLQPAICLRSERAALRPGTHQRPQTAENVQAGLEVRARRAPGRPG